MATSTTPTTSIRPVIGITLGDPAGIGPEVVAGALNSGRLDPSAEYRVIGERGDAEPGSPTDESSLAARKALEDGASMAIAGEIHGLVTGPVSKSRLREIGFGFPGQTEFFAFRTGVKSYAMCLKGGVLTVALVTVHIPLRKVVEEIRSEQIVRVGSLLAKHLYDQLSQPPRIAVAGVNPHAGESGLLGREEIEIITPAVATLQGQWGEFVEFVGPLSPDTVFYRASRGEFDGVLCMYHDQGLIPLKLHAFDEGVNVTLGLPFPRTSPDHGTAYDIAGKGIARPHSMIAAINLAVEMARKNIAKKL